MSRAASTYGRTAGAALLVLLVGVGLRAQDAEGPLGPPEVQAHLAAIESSAVLDEAGRAAGQAACREALELLRQAEEHGARAAAFEREGQEAPGRLEALRAELAQPAVEPRVEPPPEASLAQVEQLLAEAEAELQAARRQVDELRQEVARRVERRAVLIEQVTRLRQTLTEQAAALQAAAPPDQAAELTRARRLRLRAVRQAGEAELRAAQAELASYDARQELLPARRDRAQRRANQAEKAVAAWQRAVSEVRRRQADRDREAARQARSEAARRSPITARLAQENEELALERAGPEGLGARIDRATRELSQLREELRQLRERERAARRKVAAAGLTNAIGLLLRHDRDKLPDLDRLEREQDLRLDEISRAQLALIEHEEARERVGDVDARVQELLAGVLPGDGRDGVAEVMRELLLAQSSTLDGLVADETAYFNRLLELDAASRELVQGTGEYRAFIEERILWVRSVVGGRVPTPRGVAETLGWLLSPRAWKDLLQRCLAEAALRWRAATAGWLAVWFALLGLGLWARRELARRAERVRARALDSFPHTLLALPLTVLLALPVPGAVWLLARFLSLAPPQEEGVRLGPALVAGLELAAAFLLPLGLVRAVVRPGGLAEAHFRWPPAAVQRLRSALRWFTPLAVPAAALVAALDQADLPRASDELGRVAFAVEMLALAALVARTMGRETPALQAARRLRPEAAAVRGHWAWFWPTQLAPLALLVLALTGYLYTAWQLEHRLRASLWLLLGLVLVSALLQRWLYLARYRLVLDKARAAAEAQAARAAAEAKAAAPAAPPSEALPAPVAEPGSAGPADAEDVARAAVAIAAAAEAAPPAPAAPAAQDSRPASASSAAASSPVTRRPTGRLGGAAGVGAGEPASRPLEPGEDELDIPAVDAQVRTLFSSGIVVALVLGLGGIWADVLPALRLLSRVQLWPTPALLGDVVSAPSPDLQPAVSEGGGPGVPAQLPSPLPLPAAPAGGGLEDALPTVVTLADVGLAVVLLAFTLMLGKNLPGLLEILLLQRLPLDSGARYALSTILRYLITMFGLSLVLGTIGIGWAKIQWLAAALTFGLAFGLQEIFANFVSGLIILFEQPIRVGDVVTIGGVSGKVTRVRIRATTIMDWDRKELIIPNKSIVTGDVINWSLSDTTLRVVVPVGLAYGADVERALEVLRRIGEEHESVLKDPAPQAVFLGFGESSLTLELRVFVPHLDLGIPVRDALHRAIDAEFRRAGLEIAFPQRDVHLRQGAPLRVALEPAPGGPAR